jgi:hypothetical protein
VGINIGIKRIEDVAFIDIYSKCSVGMKEGCSVKEQGMRVVSQ